MRDIGLEHIEAALVQIGKELENRAVAFACGKGNRNLLLEAFEHLDVAGNGRLLNEQHIISPDGRRELDQGGGRKRGASTQPSPTMTTSAQTATTAA